MSTFLDIKQCKAEAEMAQTDWMIDNIPDLKNGDGIIRIVSSRDIDFLFIHLFIVWQSSSF